MKKKKNLTRPVAMAMAVSLAFGSIPYNVMANGALEVAEQKIFQKVGQGNPGAQKPADALSSATYYKKANWENKIKDKSRWKVEDNQRLVRVTTSDPVEMNDIDYDGNFVDANGRTVLRLVYKEKGAAATGVWYRARFNFGDLDKYIDYDKSYMVGLSIAGNESGTYPLTPVNDRKEREVDLGRARGDLTNQRKNLPINLVLNEGVTLKTLGQNNYIIQMRLTDAKGERIYAYAPKGTSMDYSTYTKTTTVDLADRLGALFIKGGYQKDGNNATAQEFFMSEFIANPEQYDDKSNLGIIRTQYTGQRSGNADIPTVGGEQIAFTQAFDAKLLDYLKPDGKGNVAYVNVLENTRIKSKWSKNVGFKKEDFNITENGKIAYLVIGTHDFQKGNVKKVEIPKHDQHTMIQGYYITAIDYVVDKSKFEDTFAGRDELSGGNASRKLNYSMISGWTNPNKDGWVIYEKEYQDGYVANEGESYLIDTTSMPDGGQIMIQFGDDDAIIRKQQGYYSYYITSDKGIEKIEEYAKGVFKFDLREGATIKAGDKLRVFMPYTKDHKDPVNFLEIHNGTKLNEGAATLTLQKDRNINMHLYTDLPRGASFKLRYTLAKPNKKGETEGELVFTKPKGLGTFWQYKDNDKVLTGIPNTSILNSGGNFYINTKKLEPGKDIIVEAYDENGKEIVERKSWFKYRPLTKSPDNVKELTWTDHSDKKAVLSINKSLYTPYQLLFTNDYAEGTDDFYKDPRAFTGSNEDFKKDTKEFVGYTKYDGGKVRTLYEEGKTGKLFAKVKAAEDEYTDKGEIKVDNSKKITIPKDKIFDPHFAGDSKEYRAYEYKVDLTKMLPYHSEDKKEKSLTLLKDMKFVSTASDGSSLPSDLYETRVRARVLFDTTEGAWSDGTKKAVKIVPDNTKFYGEDGYVANGFEGANVEANTGDKFPEAPKSGTKNFLGWVTEEAKNKLGKTTVTADEFNALAKDKIFNADTPVSKHLVVYAIYSEETAVTFDANGGKFADEKEITTVKATDGNVTKPADPTRDGFTFKGWAATKDAKTADADILKNVDAPKTVYAVWEKTEKTPLELTAPTPVEVKDTKSLTSDEIDKVKKAVVEANKDKGITEADVKVAEDGTVTVKKNGKTGTISKENTVTQKLVENTFNPPKEPVKVDNAKALTDTEKQAVRDAIKAANPDRNFTNEDITVNDDGSVKINQGGKVGSFTPDQTVVQKDTILELKAPEKTEVKDITDLTKEERDKVAAAVKEKNKDKLSKDAEVTVDNKGNVIVKDGTKTGKLEGKETVKPFTRDGKKLNPPAEKVKVGDTNKLTEQEKQAVREEVKKANPDLGFKDNEIQVDDNGEVTVPITDTKNGTFPPEKTIEAATQDDKIIKLVAPEKIEVADKTKLTQEEKNKVKEAVKTANQALNLQDDEIEVAEDGSVTVTQGTGDNQKVGQLSQADTVLEKLKAPKAPVGVKDPSKLTKEEKEAVEDAVKDVNPNLPKDATVTVGEDGTVTVKDKDGKQIGTISADKTVKKAGSVVAPAKPVEVKDPTNLTKEEKDAVEKAIRDANPELPGEATIEVGNDGTVTVKDKEGTELGKLKPEQTVKKAEDTTADKTDPVVPAKTKVADKTNLTQDEKDAVKKAIEDANKDKFPQPKEGQQPTKVEVGADGTATITYPDGSVDTIAGTDLVENKTPTQADETAPVVPAKTKVEKTDNLTDDEKAAVKKAIEDANKDKFPEGTKVTVGDDGTATITYPDKSTDTIKGSDLVEAKTPTTADKTDPVVPAKTKVEKTDNLTDDEKAAVKKAIEDANKDKFPEGTKVTVGDDGTATITYPDKSTDTIKGSDLVEAKTPTTADETAPVVPAKTKVADKTNLTQDEKDAVKKAIEDANKDKFPQPKEGQQPTKVEVGADGTATITYPDGSIDTIPGTKLVEEKATPGAEDKKAPNVSVNNNGDILVTPPANADKIIIKYTDPNGYPKEVEVTNDGNGNWTFDPADSGLKFENGNIVIPANNVQPGTEVTATAVYPGGNKYTGSANASTNPQYPIYPGHDGYNGLPLWYFYGNIGSNNTKVEPKKEVKEVKERGHHEEYMYGYPDGTFRPNANITRAEAAAMISRLKGYSLNDKTAPEFKDSKVGWFKAAINAVFKNGLMKGYEDGNFRPNDKITRAEFAQMIKNIDKSNSAVATFKDVKGHWAEDAINQAFGNGRISGYPDGTFRPDAPITRAEAVKIANSLFERSVDNSGLKEKLENPTMISKFTDVNNTHWAFYEIMEATNNHEFERRENGKVAEDWLEIDKDKKH